MLVHHLVDDSMLNTAKTIIEKSRKVKKKILFPVDVVCAKNIDDGKNQSELFGRKYS